MKSLQNKRKNVFLILKMIKIIEEEKKIVENIYKCVKKINEKKVKKNNYTPD